MLNPSLDTLSLFEGANKGRIPVRVELTIESAKNSQRYREIWIVYLAHVPELACNAQVFAAPHQRVTLASLGRSRQSARIKVLLLAASDRHESAGKVESEQARIRGLKNGRRES